jgi:Domain of unknown function (DUF4386)
VTPLITQESGQEVKTDRRTAIVVGVLFIIGTAAGILSILVTRPVLGEPDLLANISANESQMKIGALLVMIMGLALAMVPVMMFPIFKRFNEVLALGSVVFRGILETVTYLLLAISWLLLVTLSQGYAAAGAAGASDLQLLSNLVLATGKWNGHVLSIVFSLGALMIYCLFYQSRLLPRWLSIWGLVGSILYLAEPLLAIFGPELEFLLAPLALQEMVMAAWLILKGFNPVAIARRPANIDDGTMWPTGMVDARSARH